MEAVDQIKKIEQFIESNYLKQLMKVASKGGRSLVIDFIELSKFDPSLADMLLDQPEEVLKAAELAIANFDLPGDAETIRMRITNLPAELKVLIRNIRAEHLGRLLMIEGTVRQKSDVRPQVIAARFECPSCGNIMNVLQLDNKFKEPTRCGCGRKGKFRLLSKELVDAQGIVLEESTRDLEGGEQPKRMNVLLKDDLVSPISEKKTNPGSSIRVFGVIKEVPIILRTGGQSTKFDLIIEANYVEALEEDYTNIEINKEEEQQIIELSKDKKLQEKLVRSLAPGIYGHDRIKEAMLMQFVGGVRKSRSDGVQTRGDIHILLIGDPGSGKSMLLKRAAVVAPKARYVSGKGVSGAGLTASVVKDEFLSGWSLEAGALVLANRGVVMIDELDKMSKEDRGAMHEGLEQQSYHHDFELMFSDGKTEKIGTFVDGHLKKHRKDIIKGKDCEILEIPTDKILTTDFNRITRTAPARISRHKAPEQYYNIKFSNGRSITVTPEHPLFVYRNNSIGEIPAASAKKGMIVPSVRTVPVKGEKQPLKSVEIKNYNNKNISFPKTLGTRLAKLLGYIASEGHSYYSKKNRYAEIGVSNTDKEIIGDCKRLFTSIFSTSININFSSVKRRAKATKDQYVVRCSSKTLYEFFIENFPELIKKAPRKRIPVKLKKAGKPEKLAFLESFFKGDGFVDSERSGFSTSSVRLAEDLQDMMLTIGIWSYIACERRKGRSYYKVVISGEENLERFCSKIVRHDHRKDRVKHFIERSRNRKNARDCIPHEMLTGFNDFLKKVHCCDGYFTTLIKRRQNSHRKVVADYLKKAKEKIKLNRYRRFAGEAKAFEKLFTSDIKYIKISEIKKIRDKRFKWVYDVTIEPNKTFISHGLVLHNTISISKANIQATLRCETTVLAAANPKFGRFDPYETIARQIDLPPTLINRFDLIFTIKDLPDEEKDEKMAGFILNLHQSPDIADTDIDTDLLRKYLVYSRQRITPKLTDSAVQELKEYYIKMRTSGGMEEGGVRSIPISARQLEALVRLSEASAKIRLADKVTKRDARQAIALLHYCLEQVGLDPETGKIDIDRITTGIPSTERSKIITVREVINELEEKVGKSIPMEEIVSLAAERGISEDDVDDAIEKLKRSGDLFEPRRNFISKI